MFLGIDIGTSGIKATVIAEDGKPRVQKMAPLVVFRPHDLWSEQEPEDWWAAVDSAVLAIPAEIRAKVQGIGLSGQMHGATLLGADDRPLRPAILWNDGRSFAECQELERAVPESRAITGNLAMPGFTAPKLLWVRNHEPEIFAQVRTVLLPKDYVRLRMTGEKISDMSDSSGTLWIDVKRRSWSDTMLAGCGLSRAQMPRLVEGSEVAGVLRTDVATRWGMRAVPLAGGGGDNATGAAGIGAVNDGDASLSLGTSGVIFIATSEFRPNPDRAVHAFCHCLPKMWHQTAVHLSAASCLDWGARLVGAGSVAAFVDMAESSGAAAGPEVFLPYLSGERTPHNDPHARAAFLFLDNDSGPGQLAAAVLEGVAFAFADGLDALRQAGTRVEELAVTGGGARSRYWGSIIASVLGVRLVYLEGGAIGPAMGAARLARMAVTGASAAGVCVPPPTSHVIEPDLGLAERLAPKRVRFRSAYTALRSV
jgi:xylulokinase